MRMFVSFRSTFILWKVVAIKNSLGAGWGTLVRLGMSMSGEDGIDCSVLKVRLFGLSN